MTAGIHLDIRSPASRRNLPKGSKTYFINPLADPASGLSDPVTGTRPVTRPQEVLADAALAHDEKRALLASWASDACAVEGMPSWRKLPDTGSLVPLDDILDTLQVLDRGSFS